MALVAIILAAVNLRSAITALAPLLSRIEESTGIGGTTIGLLGTIPTFMFAISAFILPIVKERMTLSEMMVASLALSAIGQIIRVAYPSTWMLVLGSAIAFLAIGILNATMPLVVREYFPNHISGMALTYMMSSQLALAVAPIIGVPIARLAEANGLPGWQISLGTWAFVSLLAAGAWGPLLIRRGPNPIDYVPPPNFSIPVWRTTVGFGIALLFGCNSMVAYTLMTFLPQIFKDAGQSTDYGAAMLAISTIVGIPIILIGPWIASRVKQVFAIVAVCSILFGIGTAGLALAPMAAPIVWIVFTTLGNIVFPISMVLINTRARTLRGATALSSFGQGMGYTLASIGPLITGFFREVTGSFMFPVLFISIAGIVMLLGGFWSTRNVYVEDQL